MIGSLYNQSAYSMLKSMIPIEDLVRLTKEKGYSFLALTDDNLHGMIRFFSLCKLENIKPILGLKIFVIDNDIKQEYLVYVKTQKGYENLLYLNNIQQSNESIALEVIKDHAEGLSFVTSGNSQLENLIRQDKLTEAIEYINKYKLLFEDFNLGLSLDAFLLEIGVAPKLKKIAEEIKIKLLPIHKTLYLNHDDRFVFEAFIQIDQANNKLDESADYSMFDQNQLKQLFSEYLFVFDHLEQWVKDIAFDLKLPKFSLPKYPLKNNESSKTYLEAIAKLGLQKRLEQAQIKDHKNYQERLLFELDVIHKMGYDDYFLIVFDIVRYAKSQGILVGPGRGSAAGSLVSYSIGITDIDPIKYDLLFERFLNPERNSPPDIDLDFPDDRRDEVIQYVVNKYGMDHVASITTFGTFQFKSSVRDIARVMGLEPKEAGRIIDTVLESNEKIADPNIENILRLAKQIEGLPRHTGTHAAGIIISSHSLEKNLPLQSGSFSFKQIQFDSATLEKLGLLKIDFLGLRNLAVIKNILNMMEEKNIHFKLTDIPLDDKKTYELLADANTDGIFQLESAGIKQVLRKLKPRKFDDIVAVLALFRPGPMDQIDTYIRRRNNEESYTIDPILEPILKPTYGIIIYQEQIMQIARVFAGYTFAEADLLRRGISKKNLTILENERTKFINKSIELNRSVEKANEIYDYIVHFADYGFNKSHSVAYALIAYQMAYLKANYYPIFMSNLLTSVIGDERQTLSYIDDLKSKGYRVVAPDIEHSTLMYRTNEDVVLLPLQTIKGISYNTANAIIQERSKEPFKDFLDLKIRLSSLINEKQLKLLIHSGALDRFKLNKKTMIEHSYFENIAFEKYINQYEINILEDYDIKTHIQLEKEALGFNLKYHPLDLIGKDQLKINDIKHSKKTMTTVLIIKDIHSITNKKGEKMAFVTLDDGIETIEATMFSDVYQKYMTLSRPSIVEVMLQPNTYQNKQTYVVKDIKVYEL